MTTTGPYMLGITAEESRRLWADTRLAQNEAYQAHLATAMPLWLPFIKNSIILETRAAALNKDIKRGSTIAILLDMEALHNQHPLFQQDADRETLMTVIESAGFKVMASTIHPNCCDHECDHPNCRDPAILVTFLGSL
jgi:hypothetical protein